MGIKEGENIHRASDIIPMYQDDKENYVGQRKIKARTEVYETKNKRQENTLILRVIPE